MDVNETERIEGNYKEDFKEWLPKIKQFMTEDENCRNSDNYLFLFVAQKVLNKEKISAQDILEMPISFKTIYNIRGEIQNKLLELLPTDPRIAFRRKISYAAIKNAHAKGLITEIGMNKFTEQYFSVG